MKVKLLHRLTIPADENDIAEVDDILAKRLIIAKLARKLTKKELKEIEDK